MLIRKGQHLFLFLRVDFPNIYFYLCMDVIHTFVQKRMLYYQKL